MKIYQQILLRTFFWATVAGLLNGCAMPQDDMAKTMTEYNLVVEKAKNEMLLLNIVRASKRRPMYFTSFSKLTGSTHYEVQTTGNIPFGRIGSGLNGAYSVAPSATYSNSPVFDLTVLDSKEFTNGIMMPVPMKTIEYYWRQGWPGEMLLHLFVNRIEIKDPNDPNGKPKKILKNVPDHWDKLKDFQGFVRTSKWEIVEVNAPSIGEVDVKNSLELDKLIEMQKAGLKLRPGDGESKKLLCLNQPKYVFECNDVNNGVVYTFNADKRENRIYIRSPEAILYYLGEIIRVTDLDKIPTIGADSKEDPNYARLFYAYEETKGRKPLYKCDKAPCVSVDYEGVRYVVPQVPDSNDGRCVDRSMHVLSLVSQLIGLQKEVEKAPVTSTVSIIGQ